MASRRIIASSRIVHHLSAGRYLLSDGGALSSVQISLRSSMRFFVSKGGNDGNDDPFGVNYDDGDENLGKDLPPNYIRDKTTGKWTGEIAKELSLEEKRLLSLTDDEKDDEIVDRLIQQWREDSNGARAAAFAERVEEEEMALNKFGRSPLAQSARPMAEGQGNELHHDEDSFSQPLTPGEFKTLSRFLKKQYDAHISEDDIPVMKGNLFPNQDDSADNPDLDLAWMSTAARREMDGFDVEDPMADLMPRDINPSRLVNRRRAKNIPKELLHHNNLPLLRRYVTPNGQIMNRSQSRLGAKDQRKVAKLIKRARALGLIPYNGQWKYENHGNKYEEDIHEDKEWEAELKKRGLVKPDSLE
jgi:small subunit ribosomal protein S18